MPDTDPLQRTGISTSILSVFLCLIVGCAPPSQAPLASRSAADEKFLKICREEHGIEIHITPLEQTLWIFVPVDIPIFEFRTKENSPLGSQGVKRESALAYLDGYFQDNIFHIDYDVFPMTKSGKDPGYGPNYTDEFNKIKNNVFSAITQTYFDLENTSQIPSFMVLVIADIKRGVEIKLTFYTEDFKKYLSQSLPPEEYLQRQLVDSWGNPSIVDDAQGKHLAYRNVEWPEFLTKQILNRINFKFKESSFPPGENTNSEILKIVYLATHNYDFTAFEEVELTDVRSQKKYLYTKADLKNYSVQ